MHIIFFSIGVPLVKAHATKRAYANREKAYSPPTASRSREFAESSHDSFSLTAINNDLTI